MTSIEGFSKYLIYENGDIYANGRKKCLMKQFIDNKGYKKITLKGDLGFKRSWLVSRLVALAHIPNPENKPIVDHIDQNKINNHKDNLRWATYSENALNVKQCRNDNKLKQKNIDFFNNLYRFGKQINGVRHFKYFKTLEEAIEYRDNFKV